MSNPTPAAPATTDPAPVKKPKPVPTSSQGKYPWRATLRTVFAFVIGLAASWGVIVQALNLNPEWEWVTAGGVVAAAITRALANPLVEQFLQEYFPWLAAEPKA